MPRIPTAWFWTTLLLLALVGMSSDATFPLLALAAPRPPINGAGTVITLADHITVPAGSSMDLDPVDVSDFQQVFLLAHTSIPGPSFILVGFATEAGHYSDSIPLVTTLYCDGMSLGGIRCHDPSGNILGIYQVAGPFLAVRIENTNTQLPLTITLKAYLRM